MSNMDFFQIGALKVFAELGQLIEEDERNQIKFMDLPTDIIQNNVSKYLLEDKQINKIFNEKDDYYLLNMLFGEIKNLPYIISCETNTYKVQNDVLKAYVNRILRGFKINEEVHSIIVNFDFHPLESEIDYNEMWIEFKNESDELIARIYNDYILKIYVYDLICAKVRKAEIKAIFNDLQERTNMKIIDYFEELEKEIFIKICII
jgi:hypothetical protein